MKRRIIDILLVTIGSFISAVGYNSLLLKIILLQVVSEG